MNTTKGLRFALYARVSTENQKEEGESLDTQIKMMREWVNSIGGVVSKEYKFAESATAGNDRPSLREMFTHASKGMFDAVMVVALDRLSRDPSGSPYIEKNLRDFQLRLFEKTSESNLRTPEGKLTRQMQSVIGEFAVNRLKWAAAASRLERAKRGWPHSGMLPYGRRVVKVKDRRNQDAQWELDPTTSLKAHEMYRLYIDEGLTFADVGRRIKMNPETVRRILIEQSGGVWVREFTDPASGEVVTVNTEIPPLFDDEQKSKLLARAKQNQLERAGWENRRRDYPLSHFIRCANPECSWSNLSGHQTYDKKTRKDGTTETATYSYYNHLPRNRKGANCIHSIPAQEIEDEIFSRIGQFLKNSEVLLSAIRSAMIKNPEEIERLEREKTELSQLLASENKRLSNALDMVLEHRGTPTAAALEGKIQTLNNSISASSERLLEVQNTLKITVLPDDLEQRIKAAVSRLAGLHGHMPMHWPIEAKRALLRLFIGGDKSTRFDRSGKHVRSDERGIFISKVQPDDEAPYWTYQVKGAVGNFSGAITNVIETYEKYADEEISRQFSNAELHELARMSEDFTGMKDFRVSPPASTLVKSCCAPCTIRPAR